METLLGTVHNAKKVTIDGRDHFIAALKDAVTGRMLKGWDAVEGFDTEAEAVAWLRSAAKRRGCNVEVRVSREM